MRKRSSCPQCQRSPVRRLPPPRIDLEIEVSTFRAMTEYIYDEDVHSRGENPLPLHHTIDALRTPFDDAMTMSKCDQRESVPTRPLTHPGVIATSWKTPQVGPELKTLGHPSWHSCFLRCWPSERPIDSSKHSENALEDAHHSGSRIPLGL